MGKISAIPGLSPETAELTPKFVTFCPYVPFTTG